VEADVRISVRELVAFSYVQPDILPAAGMMEAMRAGARAHLARQSASEGEAERSIRWSFEVQNLSIQVFGRMDVLRDGEVPLIEEIKLSHEAPKEPLPEHRAQALCYAAMLACEKDCNAVRFSVCYANEDGEVLRSFPEELDAQALMQEMHALLLPYAQFALRERAHCIQRDESLAALPFPYAAYRKGQRELAVQVYTAISRKKRLFASLPTGTGKSAAVLYPALKALGKGKTEKILYLTARGTARQSPLQTLLRMQSQGMCARVCVIASKDRLCPHPVRCHPEECARAGGHFIRQKDAVDALLASGEMLWDEALIRRYAEHYQLCPFELSLRLTELADVVMMDVNHLFDPFAQIIRLYQRRSRFTLLADEAHHLVDRVRDNLSGCLDSRELAQLRAAYGKQYGRKNPPYRQMSALIKALREIESEQNETALSSVPAGIEEQAREMLSIAIAHAHQSGMVDVLRSCLSFVYALEHQDEDTAILLESHGKEKTLTLYCLLPGKEISRITKGMRGAVFFSATLHPLPAMKQLLGGAEEDACFALPSPFAPEHLAVVRYPISTRYEQRAQTARQIAQAIEEMVESRRGNYLAFFPSYAYLELVRAELNLDAVPQLWVQTRDMGEDARGAFLQAFDQLDTPRLGLCVLGGLFSEGVDLPGERLIGVMVAGVGLPVPSARLSAIRDCYQRHFGDGFSYACRIPGMHKVLQAAGRVIRSETDRGMVLLMDERYFHPEYEALLPAEWRMVQSMAQAVKQLEECE